jgi:hypothetical protein
VWPPRRGGVFGDEELVGGGQALPQAPSPPLGPEQVGFGPVEPALCDLVGGCLRSGSADAALCYRDVTGDRDDDAHHIDDRYRQAVPDAREQGLQ